jgi:hypothetical protein
MKTTIAILASVLALTACADATPVMDQGDGTYFISARAAPLRGGTTGAHSVAYSDAQKFCAQKGLRPILVGSQERDVYQSGISGGWSGGTGGFSGSSAAAGAVNMRFRCAS